MWVCEFASQKRLSHSIKVECASNNPMSCLCMTLYSWSPWLPAQIVILYLHPFLRHDCGSSLLLLWTGGWLLNGTPEGCIALPSCPLLFLSWPPPASEIATLSRVIRSLMPSDEISHGLFLHNVLPFQTTTCFVLFCFNGSTQLSRRDTFGFAFDISV